MVENVFCTIIDKALANSRSADHVN